MICSELNVLSTYQFFFGETYVQRKLHQCVKQGLDCLKWFSTVLLDHFKHIRTQSTEGLLLSMVVTSMYILPVMSLSVEKLEDKL
jgi:hypothetical protein